MVSTHKETHPTVLQKQSISGWCFAMLDHKNNIIQHEAVHTPDDLRELALCFLQGTNVQQIISYALLILLA